MFFFFWKSGGASLWKVCHQRGLLIAHKGEQSLPPLADYQNGGVKLSSVQEQDPAKTAQMNGDMVTLSIWLLSLWTKRKETRLVYSRPSFDFKA